MTDKDIAYLVSKKCFNGIDDDDTIVAFILLVEKLVVPDRIQSYSEQEMNYFILKKLKEIENGK